MDVLMNLGFIWGLHPFGSNTLSRPWWRIVYHFVINFLFAAYICSVLIPPLMGDISQQNLNVFLFQQLGPGLSAALAASFDPNTRKVLYTSIGLLNEVGCFVRPVPRLQLQILRRILFSALIAFPVLITGVLTWGASPNTLFFLVLFRRQIFLEQFVAFLEHIASYLHELSQFRVDNILTIRCYNKLVRVSKLLNKLYSFGILMVAFGTFSSVSSHSYFIFYHIFCDASDESFKLVIYNIAVVYVVIQYVFEVVSASYRLNKESNAFNRLLYNKIFEEKHYDIISGSVAYLIILIQMQQLRNSYEFNG